MEPITFEADIQEVKSMKAKNELDRTYQIRLLTTDPRIMAFGTIPGDEPVQITISVE